MCQLFLLEDLHRIRIAGGIKILKLYVAGKGVIFALVIYVAV